LVDHAHPAASDLVQQLVVAEERLELFRQVRMPVAVKMGCWSDDAPKGCGGPVLCLRGASIVDRYQILYFAYSLGARYCCSA
jgi:hypothetical protein